MAEFNVPDMTCDGCVRAITKAVQRAVPGATVEADLTTKRVRVGGHVDAHEVAEAMRDAGYTPELVTP